MSHCSGVLATLSRDSRRVSWPGARLGCSDKSTASTLRTPLGAQHAFARLPVPTGEDWTRIRMHTHTYTQTYTIAYTDMHHHIHTDTDTLIMHATSKRSAENDYNIISSQFRPFTDPLHVRREGHRVHTRALHFAREVPHLRAFAHSGAEAAARRSGVRTIFT